MTEEDDEYRKGFIAGFSAAFAVDAEEDVDDFDEYSLGSSFCDHPECPHTP